MNQLFNLLSLFNELRQSSAKKESVQEISSPNPTDIEQYDIIYPQGHVGNFKAFTDSLLSSNSLRLKFREEWQAVVNKLVEETERCLRAMVFDVELTRWWNAAPGIIYMLTNTQLLQRGVEIRRLFLVNSLSKRILKNTLLTAYVHDSIGISVRVCEAPALEEILPYECSMLSVHDDTFGTQYMLNSDPPYAIIFTDYQSISDFISFYDHVFYDDEISVPAGKAIDLYKISEDLVKAARIEIDYLKTVDSNISTLQLIHSFCNR